MEVADNQGGDVRAERKNCRVHTCCYQDIEPCIRRLQHGGREARVYDLNQRQPFGKGYCRETSGDTSIILCGSWACALGEEHDLRLITALHMLYQGQTCLFVLLLAMKSRILCLPVDQR